MDKVEVWLVKEGEACLVLVPMATPTIYIIDTGGTPAMYKFNGKRDEFGVRFYDYVR